MLQDMGRLRVGCLPARPIRQKVPRSQTSRTSPGRSMRRQERTRRARSRHSSPGRSSPLPCTPTCRGAAARSVVHVVVRTRTYHSKAPGRVIFTPHGLLFLCEFKRKTSGFLISACVRTRHFRQTDLMVIWSLVLVAATAGATRFRRGQHSVAATTEPQYYDFGRQ